jgi:hypothetical protein
MMNKAHYSTKEHSSTMMVASKIRVNRIFHITNNNNSYNPYNPRFI